MRQNFFIILIFIINFNCNDSKDSVKSIFTNNIETEENIKKSTIKKNINKKKLDTIDVLEILKDILLNKKINKIKGYSNIPKYLINYYKSDSSDLEDNDTINKDFFSNNYKYIFTDDFLRELFVINNNDLNNDGSYIKSYIKSTVFNNKVKYDFNININGNIIEILIAYLFPSDDHNLDSGSSILYKFKINENDIVIDNVIMAG